jgi:hypothetical protein
LEGAERRLLLKSVPFWKRPFWYLVDRMDPYAFEADREAIREVARATTMDDVSAAMEALHYRGRTNPNVWRNSITLRISGNKLRAIARKCFGSAPKAPLDPIIGAVAQ